MLSAQHHSILVEHSWSQSRRIYFWVSWSLIAPFASAAMRPVTPPVIHDHAPTRSGPLHLRMVAAEKELVTCFKALPVDRGVGMDLPHLRSGLVSVDASSFRETSVIPARKPPATRATSAWRCIESARGQVSFSSMTDANNENPFGFNFALH